MDVSANGPRVRLFRDVAAITMDLDAVERLELNTLGGADTITVNDLTATDLNTADVDLSASAGGSDTQPDTVITNATGATTTSTSAPGRTRSWSPASPHRCG